LEITKKEVKQLMKTEQKDTFLNHFMGMFKRDFSVTGESSSGKIKLWQRTDWTLIFYAVFTFKFDSKQHLVAIDTKPNAMGTFFFYGVLLGLLFLFIPKDLATYQHDVFWNVTLIKIIFLGLFIVVTTKIYATEKKFQLEAIYEKLDIEVEEKPTNERSLKNIITRILIYPFGILILYGSIFHFFPEGKYMLGIFGMIVISAYFISDIMLLFRKKK
jgi:hypothetical protein